MAKTTVDTLLVKIQADMSSLRREMKNVKGTVQKGSKDINSSLGTINKKINESTSRFAKLGVAIGAVFAGMAVKKIVGVGMDIENLKVRLTAMFGSVDEGSKAFLKMSEFASKVPFSLEEIQRGSGSLASVATDADHLAQLLEITGNAAALSGMGFSDASMQIQRAFSSGIASAEMFKEKGLAGMLGFEKGASVSVEETIRVFEEAFTGNGRFAKMTGELAKTLTGTFSMIGDKIFNFQRVLNDEGFFNEVKGQFNGLNTFLEENQEAFDELAKSIARGLIATSQTLAETLIFVKNNSEELTQALKLLFLAFVALKVIGIVSKLLRAYTQTVIAAKIATAGLTATMKKNLLFGGITLLVSGLALAADKMGLFTSKVKENNSALANNPFIKGGQDPSLGGVGFTATEQEKEKSATKASSDFEELKKKLDFKIKLAKLDDAEQARFLTMIDGKKLETGEKEKLNALFNEELRIKNELAQVEKDREGAEKTRIHNLEATRSRMAELKSITEEFRTEEEVLIEKQARLNELIEEFGINAVPNAGIALQELQKEIDGLNPTVRILEDNFERAFDGIAQSIADSMTEGKNAMESFKDVARAVLNSIIKDFIRLQMTQFQPYNTSGGGGGSFLSSIVGGIGSIFGGMFGGGGQSGITSTGGLSGNFGTFNTAGGGMRGFAGGGRIAPDMPTLVGERGAELFVPNTSGKIVPKSGMSNAFGGGQTVVNQTINVSAGVAQTIRAEMMNMLPSFKQETIAAVAESRLRGGQFASAFTGA